MSTTLTVAVGVPGAGRALAASAVLDSILESASFKSAHRFNARTAIAPARFEREPADVFAEADGVDDQLIVDFVYRLTSGREICCDLWYPGGIYCRSIPYSGSFRFTFYESALISPVMDASASAGVNRIPHRHLENAAFRDAVALVTNDANELFLRFCGVKCQRPCGITAGAMYTEYGWFHQAGCSMIFHAEPQQFARDLLRIYCAFHWGTPVMPTLDGDPEDWKQRTESLECTPWKERLEAHLQSVRAGPLFEEAIGELRLYEAIAFPVAKRIAEIEASVVCRWLNRIPKVRPDIDALDLGDRGFALLGTPNAPIWPAYRSILNDFVGSVR